MNDKKRELLRVACFVAAVKVYTLGLLVFFAITTPMRGDVDGFVMRVPGEARSERLREIRRDVFERLAPFDGQYYLDIAAHGYREFSDRDRTGDVGPPGNYAFFPLLPALLNVLSWLPWSETKSFVVLNLAFSVAAHVALWAIARDLGISGVSTLALLLSYPSAVFQSVLYPESLFLLLSVLCYRGVRRGRMDAFAACGLLGGACRPQGVLIGAMQVPAIVRLVRERRLALRDIAPIIAPIIAPALGLAVVGAILWTAIDNPFGFLEIQKNWGRSYAPSSWWAGLVATAAYAGPPMDWLGLVLGVGLLPSMWRRLPPGLALYGTASVALPLASGSILSMGRFLSVSFPHFLGLAALLGPRPKAAAVVVVAFAGAQNLLARGLITWHFVG